VSTQLHGIAKTAKEKRGEIFSSLNHHLNKDFLRETWYSLNHKGAPGVDGISIQDYECKLDENLEDLVARLKAGRYRASPARRVDIPKGNNQTRPLSIPSVEDRLLQKAVARILEAIFENDFLECSYGFRPGRGPHTALKDLRQQIVINKTMWLYEVDIKGYFNHVNHDWLRRMLSERIKDPIIMRLIGKWLKAGVMKDGVLLLNAEGTPQGGPISCILSNIYLHFVLDLWFTRVVQPRLKGANKLIRFVDDFVICFETQSDADRLQKVLPQRLAKFNLEIAQEKTRLICFGRFARERMKKVGRKTESFVFLGFNHVCGKDKNGRFCLVRIPSSKSCTKFLRKTKEWLWTHMHWNVTAQQKRLGEMLNGFYCYFGLPHCCGKLNLVQREVKRQWRRVLMRRSQTGPCRYWSFLADQTWFKLPNPKVHHACI
jgi:RNA-directed DNA polymerase